jgi:hypothetical protein
MKCSIDVKLTWLTFTAVRPSRLEFLARPHRRLRAWSSDCASSSIKSMRSLGIAELKYGLFVLIDLRSWLLHCG